MTHNPQLRLSISAGAFAVLLFFWFCPFIPQDQAYHDFADQRPLWGVPNFWNVITNLAFVLVGTWGFWRCSIRFPEGGDRRLRTHYRVFFIGVLFTGIGSAYYHWSPNDFTLVADRLPMSVAFMALFTIVIGESTSLAIARRWLWPLVGLGSASVIYWYLTEAAGYGDLRPYAIVQFLPMILLPLILWRKGSRYSNIGILWAVMAFYLLAKVSELMDDQLMIWTHGISGHALKHLLAAAACLLVLISLFVRRERRPW